MDARRAIGTTFNLLDFRVRRRRDKRREPSLASAVESIFHVELIVARLARNN